MTQNARDGIKVVVPRSVALNSMSDKVVSKAIAALKNGLHQIQWESDGERQKVIISVRGNITIEYTVGSKQEIDSKSNEATASQELQFAV